MLELYEFIQDLREFKIFFPNLTIFKVPPKSLYVEFQADLNKLW